MAGKTEAKCLTYKQIPCDLTLATKYSSFSESGCVKLKISDVLRDGALVIETHCVLLCEDAWRLVCQAGREQAGWGQGLRRAEGGSWTPFR